MISEQEGESELTFKKKLTQALDPYFEHGSESVLPEFKKAFQVLKQFDEEPNIEDEKEKDDILDIISKWLYKVCRDCHRLELTNAVLSLSCSFKNNLKDIEVKKQLPTISSWEKCFEIVDFQVFLSTLEDPLKEQVFTILDQEYEDFDRVSYLNRLLLRYPKTLIRMNKFQKMLFNNGQYHFEIEHYSIYYIGLIAASTYGCRYLWNQMAEKFLLSGGDKDWLIEGIQCQKIPNYFRMFAKISCNLAYNIQKLSTQEAVEDLQQCSIQNDAKLIKLFLALCYFHMLSCFSLSHGLKPENIDSQQFLQENVFLDPSNNSFQIMEENQRKSQTEEKFLNQKFTECNTWQKMSSEEENEQESPTQKLQSSNILKIMEDEDAHLQIKNLKTVEVIKKTYGKYVLFNEGCFERKHFLTEIQNEQTQQQPNKTKLKTYLFDSENYMKDSEWNYDKDAKKGLSFRIETDDLDCIQGLIDVMRENSKHKIIDDKHYFQSQFHYLYEHVDYKKLVKEQIKPEERHFIKVVGEYPYFLNSDSFEKIIDNLSRKDLTKYIMEIMSYKLELNILMIMKAVYEYCKG